MGKEKRRELQTFPPGIGSFCPISRWQGEGHHPHSLPRASLSVLSEAVRNQDLRSGPGSTSPHTLMSMRG